MLQKTIPYAILSGGSIAALAWLAQNMSLMSLYDSASTWLYRLCGLAFPLLVSLVYAKTAQARGAAFSTKKEFFLRGWLPVLAGASLLSLLSSLLFVLPDIFYLSPAYLPLLGNQLLAYTFLLCGSWLLLSTLDQVLWHTPTSMRPLKSLALAASIILVGSFLQSLLSWATVSQWAFSSNDLSSFYNALLPERVLPILFSTQQLLGFLCFYFTGLCWAAGAAQKN